MQSNSASVKSQINSTHSMYFRSVQGGRGDGTGRFFRSAQGGNDAGTGTSATEHIARSMLLFAERKIMMRISNVRPPKALLLYENDERLSVLFDSIDYKDLRDLPDVCVVVEEESQLHFLLFEFFAEHAIAVVASETYMAR